MSVLPDHAPSDLPTAAPRRRRRAALAAGGLALVAVVGGTTAWVVSAKTVTLTVDGAAREVTLHGDTVADVLSAEGLRAGAHDVLAPAAGRHVSDGDTVALRRGRELSLVVDGVARSVWVTADDVDEALQEIGLRADGAALSASRSRPIGLDGLSLEVRLPKSAGVLVDGATAMRTTTARTVGDLLAEAGVTVRPSDTTDVPATTAVTEGLVVRVTRHDVREDVEEVAVPFPTVRTADAAAYVGTERTTTAGRPGTERRTWSVTLVDGQETGRTLVSSVRTAEPVAAQVAVGSRPKPAPAPAPAAAPVPSGSGGGLNWAALARCESGGDPRGVGGGGRYFGLYQFSLGTWAGVGGSGNPASASAAEQTARAQALYARAGRSPWPVCGRYL